MSATLGQYVNMKLWLHGFIEDEMNKKTDEKLIYKYCGKVACSHEYYPEAYKF